MFLDHFKYWAAFIIFIVAVLGGLWPFLKGRGYTLQEGHHDHLDLPIGESLATGIFLGAGLLHMLPDAATAFNQAGYHYPFAFLIASSSFLLLLFIEHLSVTLEKAVSRHLLGSIAILTVIMLSIHSLLEGGAVGVARDLLTTLIIFVAIIAHKGAASFALALQLNRSTLSFTTKMAGFFAFITMTPIGIILGNWLIATTQATTLLTPILSALAAGTFIYIGTLHGLERASLIKHCCNLKEFTVMVLGFTLMAIVGIWA